MPVVSSMCPVDECRFHNVSVVAEIVQTKAHIRSHDYKILLETAYHLSIIDSTDERRSLDWLVDELFKIGMMNVGVASY